tara:strand:- start:1581 stop:1841 length:261 start_codon:yes stop_codon:yes gene_type:complete
MARRDRDDVKNKSVTPILGSKRLPQELEVGEMTIVDGKAFCINHLSDLILKNSITLGESRIYIGGYAFRHLMLRQKRYVTDSPLGI